jgi:hypothetical protein
MELNRKPKEIRPGKLGGLVGSNPKGETFGFTSFYMTRNGEPFIPVVGEFHFSRFSYLHWEEELLKMKAGGVHIVATYVFWIFHEEEEGRFDWGGSRNLRHFIDLCAKLELPLILRIGPFCHGEVRNGGIPDWLFGKALEIRSNDPAYLDYARKLYREIARQMKGTLYQEGGPVIGVQLENEYMHCGAPFDAWGYKSGVHLSSGQGGNAHLAELRRLAEEAGIRPMLFTATAWGGAAVPETDTLPMLAGYAYTPWIPNQPPSREYLYRDLHAEPAEPVNYDSLEYPVAYCEMAGGMQVSYHARPLVNSASVEAMTLVKLASGSNLLGYYMYHGGSNPIGKHTYLNEAALPKVTYDYQSPLGEFGRVAPSYDKIRSLSMFMGAYGAMLAPMGTQLPADQAAIVPEDTDTLRWCVRHRDGAGFVFLNNFQDHLEMPSREGIRIELSTPDGIVSFPRRGTLSLKNEASAVLPFQLRIDDIHLVSATVQPLTRLQDDKGQAVLVFYAHEGMEPELALGASSVVGATIAGEGAVEREPDAWLIRPAAGKGNSMRLELADGRSATLLVLTREEALQAYKLKLEGRERLVLSDSRLYVKAQQLVCTSPGRPDWRVCVYPDIAGGVQLSCGKAEEGREGLFHTYALSVGAFEPTLDIRKPSARSALVRIEADWPEQVADVFLEIEYEGDVAGAYLNNRLITDHIHYGEKWPIGLKEFRNELEDGELHLSITPLRQGTVTSFVNQALVERFEGVEVAAFNGIRAVPHYVSALVFGR